MAHGGGGDAGGACSPPHGAELQELIQGHEEVEIDGGEVHGCSISLTSQLSMFDFPPACPGTTFVTSAGVKRGANVNLADPSRKKRVLLVAANPATRPVTTFIGGFVRIDL